MFAAFLPVYDHYKSLIVRLFLNKNEIFLESSAALTTLPRADLQ